MDDSCSGPGSSGECFSAIAAVHRNLHLPLDVRVTMRHFGQKLAWLPRSDRLRSLPWVRASGSPWHQY